MRRSGGVEEWGSGGDGEGVEEDEDELEGKEEVRREGGAWLT